MNNSSWSSDWNTSAVAQQPNPTPSNPWDSLSQDQLLMLHLEKKNKLAELKEEELELRKYIVNRAFPNKVEGTNTLDLGGGYQLKAGVKFNYTLKDSKLVEDGLDLIAKVGNQGAFIADRLVSWTPNFLLTEYRKLQDDAKEGSQEAKDICMIIDTFLTIDDAAPTLEVKKPKAKKK